ncbi:hypothetical protein [Shewanella pealeana]|uniref:Uncharacterized protein n=1 Tax=Shewanella pealeana (strain ATCC 700345 / ANG-SQ1) TaxID=398579 RepID=A8H7D7_SHEPA|nr:hypothetical protein [Shewanella pealeana]ABV88474.1 conserved hypothetical protein [Shewanella pealeana ATCC 700345]
MEKNAYLDAMGITRWKKAIPQADIMTVLVNPLRIKDVDSPIIGIVLSLIGADVNHCRFAVRAEVGSRVIWDMRGKQAVSGVDRVVSAPINELESSVEAKRALWANMQAYMLSKEA